MNKVNWLNLFWELFKTLTPSIVAWYLAVRTSNKKSEKDKKEAREQLRVAKDYNAEVQNKAYKLQFCLRELENREQLYERALSDTNVVTECVHRYLAGNGSSEAITASARQLIDQIHLLMYSIGTTDSLVSAVRPNERETFRSNLELLKQTGDEIKKGIDYFAHERIKQGTLGRKQVVDNFNDKNMDAFFKQLLAMRNLIMELIYIVLDKMG